jgi:hypothetical protein
MKPQPPLNLPAQLSIAALVVLGLVGGSLIVAHAGFATSPRRGGSSTFVPAPQAYVLAVVMYLMSCLALLALLRNRNTSRPTITAALCAYASIAALLVVAMARHGTGGTASSCVGTDRRARQGNNPAACHQHGAQLRASTVRQQQVQRVVRVAPGHRDGVEVLSQVA